MVHGEHAGHGQDSTAPLGIAQLQALVHSALPLHSTRFVKGRQSLTILPVKTGGALVDEGDVGIEQFHHWPILGEQIVEKISRLGAQSMQADGVVLELVIDRCQPQQLDAKAFREVASLGVRQHPLHLPGKLLLVLKATTTGNFEKGSIRHVLPKEIRKAFSELEGVDRRPSFGICRLGQKTAVKKFR